MLITVIAGLDWDLLYVGTCWDIPNMDNRPKYQIYNDPFGPNRAEYAVLSLKCRNIYDILAAVLLFIGLSLQHLQDHFPS